jgi:iron(III) transport system permease protein
MGAARGARRMRISERLGERLLVALLVLLVLGIAALPMARLLLEGFLPGGVADFTVARRVFSAPVTWRAAGNSLALSAGATLIALAIGAPAALLVALSDIRGKAPLVFCFLLPMMIPAQIATIAWIALVGPGSALLKPLGLAPPPGAGNPLYSSFGIMLVMGIEHSSILFLTVRAAARSLPGDVIEAAEVAGAPRAALLGRIILPLLAPSLAAGSVLAFVSSLGNFGVPALLGIPAGIITLPTLIYQRLAGFGPAILSDVAMLSLLMGAIACAGLALQSWITGRQSVRPVRIGARPHPLELGRGRAAAELACWVLIALMLLLPLIALLATSLVRAYGLPLTAETVTLAHYRTIFSFDTTARAFANSLLLAGGAALLLSLASVPFGYVMAWRGSRLLRIVSLLAELPYALPGLVVAIAAILTFLKPLPIIGVSVYGTLWIIFLAYLARFFSLALRPVLAAYAALSRSLEEAAEIAGAGLFDRLRLVILPLIAPVAAAGGLLVFLTALNELTISILLWSSGRETLGVIVYSLQEGGSAPLAASVSVLAILVILALMLGASALARRLPAGTLPWQN